MRTKTLLAVLALAFCLCLAAPTTTFAQNLLTNGSFQNGDFSGWTTGGNFIDTFVEGGAFSYYSGDQDGDGFWAALGPVGADGSLSQTFSDHAGAQYTISFWFASNGDNPSDFSVFWNTTQLLSLTNPNTGVNWMQYTFQATGTGTDTLTFNFADNPAYMALDNVSVTQNQQTVPEPSSLLLLGTGVLGLGGMVRRKLRR
jgi:hypothetical protein